MKFILNYRFKISIRFITIFIVLMTTSCEDFVAIDPPRNEIVSETIFSTDETATSALVGIYGLLSNLNGGFSANMEVATGMASDELINHSTDISNLELSENNILPNNSDVFDLWRGLYRVINNANAIIIGLENNTLLTPDVRDQLQGEALFIRAVSYFYLTNFFGDIPYITSTDVEGNDRVFRDEITFVYEQIITDLNEAIPLLSEDYAFDAGQRVRANQGAARSLLARIYLYRENWAGAEAEATLVLNQSALYALETDLGDIFLDAPGNNTEAIWQLASLGVSLPTSGITSLGEFLIPPASGPFGGFGNLGNFTLSDEVLAAFETEDQRIAAWTGTAGSFSFVNKYKNGFWNSFSSGPGPAEHVMMIRLAEVYLIRAEARAHLGNIPGAQQDLNSIRNRAGLPDTSAATTEALLDAILQERKVELFAEGGHRWFDLKRTGRVNEILSSLKNDWQPTDALFPVPEQELLRNNNLTQNPGY